MKLNRRIFNKQLLISAGGLTLVNSLPFNLQVKSEKKGLGIALVGLGSYSSGQLAPALQETSECHLAGIVTGTPAKEKQWAQQYDIPQKNIYNYQNFDDIKDNDDIDIVYVVLPNAMHAEFSIRAAKAGKHVICEKPMAMNVEECDAIIQACNDADVKLSVGYRLQSEPYTQEVKSMVREKTFGEVRYVQSDAAYISRGNPDQWRLNIDLSGGGALMNMGVYAIQSNIYGSGMNPISVTAQEYSTRPEYFKKTDETITAQFEFPNGATGNMMTSHNIRANRHYTSCDNGWFELQPANSYGPLKGRRSDGTLIEFPHRSQQALQMDDFARHIAQGTVNRAPGEMGKRDMIIVEAIYKSIRNGGTRVDLDLGNLGIVSEK
ncbi:Gfo/Idh/MocA family protein [Portibacter marinus]|uniref:Gfo/Idh/MocA family protein n=1 Tax=Portibacter marinus TaxID=2898660 RepID=UPI001F1F3409|nr:Gfo/Idh/MocA family oxidoreductase [Portibacter marinus]